MAECIYAQASASGRAGVAVVRLSGGDAHSVAARIAGPLPPVRRAALRRLRGPDGVIDRGLVIVFEAGASFTGEPVVEFHVHGSRSVVAALGRALAAEGARLAEPGEFTRRAFLAGRMDLSEVEGLGDLLEAETEVQRVQALRLMEGGLSEVTGAWRADLLEALALLEVTIDFADEEVPVDVRPEVASALARVRAGLQRELAGAAAAERVRDGVEVAIVGRPNIGKSTLLNHLAGRAAALTSEVAGTTRDVIEVRMDIGGLPVTLLDTAGMRETEDHVEQLGVAAARARAEAAEMRLFLVAAEYEVAGLGVRRKPGDLVVRGKADLRSADGLAVSGLTGAGIPELLVALERQLSDRVAGAGLAVRTRHREGMTRADAALGRAEAALPGTVDRPELIAEEVRTAVRALDALVGRVDVEHILGEIFGRFCLGK